MAHPVALLLVVLRLVQGEETYWVAPSAAECGDRTPCTTLSQYAQRNSSLFSLSNAKWMFLEGEHVLTAIINFWSVNHVSLVGESLCSSTGIERCSKVVFLMAASTERRTCVYGPTVNFFSSTNISIVNLDFFVSLISDTPLTTELLHTIEKDCEFKGIKQSILQFDIVDGVVFRSVTLSSEITLLEGRTVVSILDPYGQYLFYHSKISHHLFIAYTPDYKRQPERFYFEILHGVFGNINIDIPMGGNQPDQIVIYASHSSVFGLWKIDIGCSDLCSVQFHVYNSHFYFGSLHTKLTEKAGFTFFCLNCSFQNSWNPPAILIQGESCTSAKMTIENSVFAGNEDTVLQLQVAFCSLDVLLSDCRFLNNTMTKFKENWKSNLLVFWNTIPRDTVGKRVSHSITLNNMTIQYNRKYSHHIYLHEFQHSPPRTSVVRFTGESHISHNIGGGICLNSSQLLVLGQLTVSSNQAMGQVTNGLTIAGHSQLLLSNNSIVTVSKNEGFGVIVMDYLTTNLRHGCFLALVDSRYDEINSGERNFKASLIITGNYFKTEKIAQGLNNTEDLNYIISGNQIYNGRLPLCADHVRDHIELDSNDDTTVGSPPYHVCVCGVLGPAASLRICASQNSPQYLTIAPAKELMLEVVALGGEYQTVVVKMFATVTESGVQLKQQLTVYNHIRSCTKVVLKGQWNDNTVLNFAVQGRVLGDTLPTLVTTFFLKQRCPPGTNLTQGNDVRFCACKPMLSQHGFQCILPYGSLYPPPMLFQAPSSTYWLGYWQDELVFSESCPSHYCNRDNSTLFNAGLTLDQLNSSEQCNPSSNRQGLLCSQCASGTSATFGSNRCSQCSYAGLLLVPLAALLGIGLIAALFLFNFTVLQGDIVGIAFYFNMASVLDEFLLEYAPKPLYIVLSLLNFQLGFETCFFNGMNELAKSLIHFVFPLYLIALVVVIIIAAHKFNLRIFRVRFIARRSVPVLATLMLQTYTGLVNAVIYGLQYTTVYRAESSESYIAWSHQPELKYFGGRHIAVGVLSLAVALLYLLPFTFVTLFGDLLRRCSRNLWYSHFMDVFHGAFHYPFGFWFGTRLLLQLVFIVLKVNTGIPTVAYALFLAMGTLLLLQLLLEPFRTDNVTLYTPDPQRRHKLKEKIKVKLSEIFRPKVIDSLYLFNIMFIATAVSQSLAVGPTFSTVGVCASILLALGQLFAVTVHHMHKYFPVPSCLRQRAGQLCERVSNWRETARHRFRRRRETNAADEDDNRVEVIYLSASMCINGEDGPSSCSEDHDSAGKGNDDDDDGDSSTRSALDHAEETASHSITDA